MAVSLFTDGNRHYWRAYRKWDGKVQGQLYFPLHPDPHKAMEEAIDADMKLAERQRAFYLAQMYRADYWMKENGKIRGLSLGLDGHGRPQWRLQISLPWTDKQARASRSILASSPLDAFQSTIKGMGDLVGFDSWSELAKALKQCYPDYAEDLENVMTQTDFATSA